MLVSIGHWKLTFFSRVRKKMSCPIKLHSFIRCLLQFLNKKFSFSFFSLHTATSVDKLIQTLMLWGKAHETFEKIVILILIIIITIRYFTQIYIGYKFLTGNENKTICHNDDDNDISHNGNKTNPKQMKIVIYLPR